MKPNILFIVSDAVRAQNLPFYGYPRNTTPFLSSMEEDLAIYENAVSSAYWTMPSVASLFTGMYTSGHGLVADGDQLDASLITLPKVLRKHGYRCSAFVRNVYVSEYSGLTSDFNDCYSQYELDHLKKHISSVFKKTISHLQPPGINRFSEHSISNGFPLKDKLSNAAARSIDLFIDSGGRKLTSNLCNWLERHTDRPFFAYIHFLETHSPYRAPLKYALNFSSVGDQVKKLFVNHDHLEVLSQNRHMTSEDFRILTSAYDNSIRYVDHLTGKIIRALKDKGLYDNTMIVFLSDHGDNIGDHGLMFHYWCLYDTLIKIPLLIKYPVKLGLTGRIPKVVQNVDLLPTLLGLLGDQDEQGREQYEGNDLLERMPPKRESDVAISELVKPFGPDRIRYKELFSRFDRRLLSVRTHDRKFIYSSRGDHECYDLISDPSESMNLYPIAGQFRDLESIAIKYYKRMDAFYGRNIRKIEGGTACDSVDQDIMEQLQSLGYA